ncbi:MAG: TolB family protein, partial [Pyrinomonadaceae bacterium]
VGPGGSIYRVMTLGGIPTNIAENTQGWISVSPDDRQISFVRCPHQDEDYCSLFIVDTNGKNERKLSTQKRPLRISDNQFSPDGRSIAFAVGDSSRGANDFRLMRINLADGSENQITSKTFFDIRSLKWLPHGQDLLFTANERLDGPLRIWQTSLATGEVTQLTKDASNYGAISLNKTADKMVATYSTNTFQLYVAPVGDLNSAKSVTPARTFAFGSGDQLVYAADDGDIWTINRDGGEQHQLTNSAYKEFDPRVSPDGRYIFFASARSGSNHVWRMNADGSNQIQLTTEEGGPRFVTRDQQWVYFESVLNTLWKIPPEGGDEIQVSPQKVSRTAFSPDAKLVAYFFRPEANDYHFRIGVMSLDNGNVLRTFALAEEKSRPTCLAWEANNKNFDYVISARTNSLWRQSLTQDRPSLIADFGKDEINDLALSLDGKYIGFIRGRWIQGAVLIEGLR